MLVSYSQFQELASKYRIDQDTDIINPDFLRKLHGILSDFDVTLLADVVIKQNSLFVESIILKSDNNTILNLISRFFKTFVSDVFVEDYFSEGIKLQLKNNND